MKTIAPPHDTAAPTGLMDDRLLFWVTQGLQFGILSTALLIAKATVLDRLVGAETASRTVLLRMAFFVVDAALLAAIYRQPAFRRIPGPLLSGAATVAACLAVAAFDGAASTLLAATVIPGGASILEQYPLLAAIHRIMVCVAWSIVYHALRQRSASRAAARRLIETDLALRTSELERLGQQIEPHFLFNALSAVLACRHDAEAVEAITTALADYLRFCLSRQGGPEPLALELDAIEQLLSVHETRFRGSLECRVTSSPAARRALVPPMLVSPLIDNALKFSGQTSPKPRRVEVEARVHGEHLVVEVMNTGSWIEPATDRPGTGLANLRRRLQLSGLSHPLEIETHDGRVTVRLTLPATASDSSPRRSDG